jgi:hypothetical protein
MENKLVPSTRYSPSGFGVTVAIDNDTIVVGAINESYDENGANPISKAGAVYVFTGTNGTHWQQQQKLVASGVNSRKVEDFFGDSVSIYGDTIVVGSSQSYDENGANFVSKAGAIYVFTRSGTVWTQQQKLVADSRNVEDFFGYSSHVYEDTIVAGAYGHSFDVNGLNSTYSAGAAFVFTRSGTVWAQQQKLVADSRNAQDYFGRSVSIYSNTAVIGSYGHPFDTSGLNSVYQAGAVYTFTRSGTTWAQQQKLVATGTNSRQYNDSFGWGVSIYDDKIVVGAPEHSFDAYGSTTVTSAGAAYVFIQIDGIWTQQQKIVAIGLRARSAGDLFGETVCISSDVIIVGSRFHSWDANGVDSKTNAGAAYVFTSNGASWQLRQKLVGTGANGRNEFDVYGMSVAAYGDFVVVGSDNYFDENGSNELSDAGAVYLLQVFSSPSISPSTSPSISPSISPSFSPSISPSTSPSTSPSGSESPSISPSISPSSSLSPSASVSPSAPVSFIDKLVSLNRRVSHEFGTGISFYGDTIAVGVPKDFFGEIDDLGDNLTEDGSVYVFTKFGGFWTVQQRLIATGLNSRNEYNHFGQSVSLYEDTLVVGADGNNHDENGSSSRSYAGAAYVFTRSGTVWAQQQKLVATGINSRNANDHFGLDVSVHNDTVIVGSSYHEFDANGSDELSNAGAAYIFTRSGSVWAQQQKLAATGVNGRKASDFFGSAVSVYSDLIAVGAYQHAFDENGANSIHKAGATYVFTRSGTTWTQCQKLVSEEFRIGPTITAGEDLFGSSVYAYEDKIIVGAPFQSYHHTNAGAAYVFKKNGDVFIFDQKFVPTGVNESNENDLFGSSVTLHNNIAIVGAIGHQFDLYGTNPKEAAGAAFVFVEEYAEWTQHSKITGTGTNGRQTGDFFGCDVAAYGETIVAGAYGQDFDENGANELFNAGAVYIISPFASPSPSISPSTSPSKSPSISPSKSPSQSPSISPSFSLSPSESPSRSPSIEIPDWYYTSDGGVVVDDSWNPTEFTFTIGFNCEFKWTSNSCFYAICECLWNSGELPDYWYRIEGKCKPGDPCDLAADTCLQRVIVNIHARTLTELCQKLRKKNLSLTINNIKKFPRPAALGNISSNWQAQQLAIANYDSTSSDCQQLEDVSVCQIPACFDFCVDYDVVISVGVNAYYIPKGESFTYDTNDVALYLSGSGDYSLNVLDLFKWDSHPEVCYVNIEGESYCEIDPIPVGGGCRLGGVAQIIAPDWSFDKNNVVKTDFLMPSEFSTPVTLTAPDEPNRVPLVLTSGGREWVSPEILLDLSGRAYASLRYGGVSDIIVVKNFGFDIPSGCVILDIEVSASRFGSKSLGTSSDIYDNLVVLTVDNVVYSTDRSGSNLTPPVNDIITGFTPWIVGDTWDIDVFNSSSFGVAYRAKAMRDTGASLVFLDFIKLAITYGFEGTEELVAGGSSTIKFGRYSFTGSGGVLFSGDSRSRKRCKFFSTSIGYLQPTSFVIGGAANVGYFSESSGEIQVSGDATCIFDDYHMHNGVRINGMAEVKPFLDIMQCGVKINGLAVLSHKKFFEASGSVAAEGSALWNGDALYSASGAVEIYGSISLILESWVYAAQGGVTIEGESHCIPGNVEASTVLFSGSMTISSITGSYTTESAETVSEIAPNISAVSRCGCTDISDTIFLSHNLNKNNILSKFLIRNNLSLDRIINLYFNSVNNCWQNNIHYTGYSPNINNQESWSLIFTVQCTDEMGGVEIGMNVWKVSILIIRKNLDTNEDFNSHICFAVYPKAICATKNQLDIKFDYNTQAGSISIKPSNTIVYQLIVFDNIGIFKSSQWITDPDLQIVVSQSGIAPALNRYDIYDATVPKNLAGNLPSS